MGMTITSSLRFLYIFDQSGLLCAARAAAAAAMRMRKRKAVTERHERAYKGNLMALLATSLAKGVCLVITLMKFSELSLFNLKW